MFAILEKINGFIWGIPALIMVIGVGLYISLRTGFAQISLFPRAVSLFIKRFRSNNSGTDEVSGYQALCTALAATVGTGNLAGVAGAIAIGGPGAILWMWVCGVLGMVTKYAEAVLAVRYRKRNQAGEWVGGPMYMIHQGMEKRWHFLAGIYCFFGVVASFGVGNATQINTVLGGVNSVLTAAGITESVWINLAIGTVLAVLITRMFLGGAGRIGKAAEKLVPFASVAYLLLCVIVLFLCANRIPGVFSAIFQGAFQPNAVTGGMLGSAFVALRIGASRGVFTNEAGMGTAAIAHASAQVEHPVEQGMMGIMEVFLDTIVICTMTALVILCSGIIVPYGEDQGILLTANAFSAMLGDWVRVLIMLLLCCFAIATVLGWGLYGARCAQFLFGDHAWRAFVYLQALMVIIGAVLQTDTVWLLAEIVNGLMAIPNLIALAWLSPELIRLTKEYRRDYIRRKSAVSSRQQLLK